MISYIQKVRNVGCYDEFDFDSENLNQFGKINILYGNNGCGKTTLSNVFYLLSKHCKNKSALLCEIMDSDCEVEIFIGNKKITHKNIADQELDLYVFNSKFITDHVYNGNCANIDAFSSSVKLTSPRIAELDAAIHLTQLRCAKFRTWLRNADDKLEAIFKSYKDEFNSKVDNSRLNNVKPLASKKVNGNLSILKTELSQLYSEYAKKNKEDNTVEKIEAVLKKMNSIIKIGVDVEEVKKKLALNISSAAKGLIAERINNLQKKIDEKSYGKQIEDLNDWVKKGGRLLHLSKELNNHCPLCNQDLTLKIDSIIQEYSVYFSTALTALFDFIDSSTNTLNFFIENEQLYKNSQIIEEVIQECNREFNTSLLAFDYSNDVVLLELLENLRKSFREKKMDTAASIGFDSENQNYVIGYNQKLAEIIRTVTSALETAKAQLQKRSLSSIVSDIKAKISVACAIEFNEKSNSIFFSKTRSNSDIVVIASEREIEIKQKVIQLSFEREKEINKLNAESQYINIYLNHFGISNFSIERDKEKTQNNIIVTYAKSGRKKTNLMHSLSEGEKTALAFAYFMSKLRVEKLEGNNQGFENCIIVIDDPISSLDDNRLFQTANLIDSFFFHDKNNAHHYPEQVFIFSHNITFVKFIYNALKTNKSIRDYVEEFYLSNNSPRIQKLPAGLKNFTNTYLLKLKEVIDFKDKKLSYDHAKNYLPNYIRIVLETFRSFKLALVNDGLERLPGLSHLINRVISQLKDFDDEILIAEINKDGVIKRLNHLKRIADHESHGSIYKAEEFSFISEEELRTFAKSTLKIMEYLDSIHYKGVKALC